MRIRAEQIDSFQTHLRAQHQQRVVAFFREQIPEHIAHLSDVELDVSVAEAIGQAEAHSVATGVGLLQFVALSLLVDRHFYHEPTIKVFLNARDGDIDSKLDQMTKMLGDQLGQYRQHRKG
jgi:hypothetical protein